MPAYIAVSYGLAQTILPTATSLGQAVSAPFIAPNDYTVLLTATEVGVFTTLTFNLVASLPTGDTQIVGTWDAVASNTTTVVISRNLSYKLVCTGFSGGTSVAVTAVLTLAGPSPLPTQPVSAVSLPLPAGASTDATLALIKAKTDNIDVALSTRTKPADTQTVSGTVTANIGTSGFLALDATLTGGTQKTKLVDTGGTNVASVSAAGALKVDGSGVTQPVSGTVTTTPPANASTNVAQVAGTATDTNSGTKSAGTLRVVLATDQPALTNALKVDGSAVTQPVSAAALPLPAGASTVAKQPALGTAGTASADVISVQGVASMTALKVDGSAVTQPVSSVSLPLPAGASTAAKQPALGTAGTASADVISVQGVASMTALKVDGSGVTQPVSGTVTASQATGTNLHMVVDSGTITAVTAITNALPTGANTIGSVKITDGTTVPGVIAGTTALKTDLSSVAGTATVTAAAGIQKVGISDSIGAALNSVVKGTQAANALGTQDLKDSGRTAITFSATGVVAGTSGTETAITLTKSAGTAATTTGVSFVVTSGKTFRITSINVASRGNVTATAQKTTFNLRLNTGGAVVVTSTPVLMSLVSATPATALAYDRFQTTIPDGFEIAGNGTIQIGLTANTIFVTNGPTWDVLIVGFEY